MTRKISRLLLFVLFPAIQADAQLDQLEFERYTVRQGLSHNTVNAITQDDNGHIWIGTDYGLNQFDGTTFRHFYQNKKGTGIPGNRIVQLKYFGRDRLGVLSRNGFQELNTGNFSHTNFLIKDTTIFYTYLNQPMDVAELDNGYAMLTNAGFCVFDRTGRLLYRYDHYKRQQAGNTRMLYGQNIYNVDGRYAVLYVLSNSLGVYDVQKKRLIPVLRRDHPKWKNFFPAPENWTIRQQTGKSDFIFLPLGNDSIYFYNHTKGTRTASALPFRPSKEFYWASYIFFLDDSTFAINCAYGGVYTFHLDRNTGRIRCDGQRQLQAYRCNWIFKDRENRLWVGTNQGLLKQRSQSVFIRAHHYNQNPEESNAFFNKVFAYGGYLFLSRNSWTDGLYVIDATTMKVVKTIKLYGENSPFNSIYSIQSYYRDTLWLSTAGGLLWMKVPDFSYGKINTPGTMKGTLLKMARAGRDDKAWMCGILDKIVAEYDLKTRKFTVYHPRSVPALPNIKPKHIVTDAFGDVWIGGHGLARWNQRTRQFDRVMSHYAGKNKYEDDILFMEADERGYLWFHCVSNGLLKYDIQKNIFTTYTDEEGIPSDILCMSPVTDDGLWLGASSGLTHFDPRSGIVHLYNHKNGLPDDQFTSREIYYDRSANRYLTGFNNYLLEFSGKVQVSNKKKNILVKELIIRNSDTLYYPRNDLFLEHDQNNLALTWGIIDYDINTPYQISYRVNRSSPWNLVGQQPVIYLDNLRPGKHIVELKAVGQANNITVKTLTLYINAPLWQKAWFILLVILAVLLLVFLAFRHKLRSARKEGKLNQLLAEYEMKALHAQMNPHFIFNCLNSIKALIMYDRNREASVYINRFSRLVRQNLEHSRKQFITLRQNIEYLQDYLEMENFRFTNFQYTLQLDTGINADEIKIAPMLLQPLVENAIWHGLQLNGTNNMLTIRFINRENWIECEIEDNGIGINRALKEKKSPGNALGIANIQQRMKVLNEKYNLSYHLRVIDKSDLDEKLKGTLATVSFNSF